MDPFDLEAPFLWTLSENGNFTCEWSFLNATVFASDGGFKNVVNADGGSRESAIFSEVFSTESAAALDAEYQMQQALGKVLSRREARTAWEEDEDGNWFLDTETNFIAVSPRGIGWGFSIFDNTTNPPTLTNKVDGHATADEARVAAMELVSNS